MSEENNFASSDFKVQHPILSSKDIFFRCVEDSNEPIMVTDLEGKIIYVNPAWTASYGYSREEAIGETPRLLRSKHQDIDFYKKLWGRIKDSKYGYWKGELINQAKDGSEVPVLLSITPYRSSENGNVTGYMAVALNLSEQKNLENQVRQQDRLVTIGELSSGLAHEIGTPIGVIRGRAEMLQMQLVGNAQAEKSLDVIIRQIDRIHSLMSTLLRLSRKQDELRLLPISLQECCKDMAELFEYKLNKGKIQFHIELEENLVALADFESLEQISINLIVNSLHAIEEACKLNPDREKHIYVRGTRSGERVLLEFEDTGMGIPEEIIEKIFNPFFTTKPTSQGTGLGLSIVSRLVEELGGKISVTSKLGEGTRFALELRTPY